MPAGHPTSFRLSAEAETILASISERTGLKRSAVMEALLREAERRGYLGTEPRKKSRKKSAEGA